MKVHQLVWKNNSWNGDSIEDSFKPQLCLLFGTRQQIDESRDYHNELKSRFSSAQIVVSSTAGNILDDELMDDVIVANLIYLEHTEVICNLIKFGNKSGVELGEILGNTLNEKGANYGLVFSCMGVNAGHILKGYNSANSGNIPLSGGIAGDNYLFEKTLVGLNEDIGENQFVVVAFKGNRFSARHGSKGGWDVFGPERAVTKCEGNVLYEIDEKPALDLYKNYLGEKSSELPTSALHFPLAYIDPVTKEYIVRGVQGIDEETNSLILYGDLDEGLSIQLMKANFDRVIQGAEDSASDSINKNMGDPDFSLLISCVARRLALDQLVEEELEGAKSVLGKNTKISGFYSYTELSPVIGDGACRLHNQTMTITSFYER